MFNLLLTTIAAVSLFGFNNTEIPIEDPGENGNIIYFAPDLDLSTGTEEQIQTLRDIGWNLDAEVPYLVEEKISSGSVTSIVESPENTYINIGELFDNMGHDDGTTIATAALWDYIYYPPAHGTKVYKFGDKVHCNRFNGPSSDNKHYPKDSVQGLINFRGSDCAISVGLGYCTVVSDKCNTSEKYHRGWCSKWLNHNYIYHKHS